MKRRMITRLADPTITADFYGEISRGLNTIYENSTTIMEHAKQLYQCKGHRGAEILASVSEEEAAKILILLDAVRCPKPLMTRQLSYAYSHLAKGIYSMAYWWRCSTLGEVRKAVKEMCVNVYLDGDGEGQTWICENSLLQEREDKIYVDCVWWDDIGLQWNSPKTMEDLKAGSSLLLGRAFEIMHALYEMGITAPDALKIVEAIWTKIIINDDFSWIDLQGNILETFSELSKSGLLKLKEKDPTLNFIVEYWFFPLCHLDLRQVKVNRQYLNDVAEQVRQDWWESIV